MKIGINALSVTPDSTGGGTTYISELINHLSQIDFYNEYVLFIRSGSKHHFGTYGSNFKFISIRMPPLLPIVFRVLADHLVVPLLAWRYKLDVLFYPGDSLPFWVPCASVVVIQNLLHFHRHKFSSSLHRTKNSFYTKARILYYEYFVQRSVLRANKIITVSERAKREIVENFKVAYSKISVVYHGVAPLFGDEVDEQHNARKLMIDNDIQPDYLLYVGAVAPHKNIEGIIAGLAMLKKNYSIVRQLVIAGSNQSGYATYLRSVADKLGVLNQVVFLGHVPYEELPLLYCEARVFILLSLCESFGLPILEAMACGCPVICSNVSSLPEIAGNAAVLVDPKDPINLADMIKVLCEDEEYRHRMIDMGKKRAQKFSWTRTADQIISVIEQAARD